MSGKVKYVPLVYIDVKPVKNAEHPAIEMSTRTTTAPVYMLPLFKAKWGRAAKVTSRPLLNDLNPLYEVLEKTDEDGAVSLSACDHERQRMERYFNSRKRDVFHEVYSDTEWEDMFAKVAKDRNPWLEQLAKSQAEAEDRATKTAATSLLKAAGEAEGKRAMTRARAEASDDMSRRLSSEGAVAVAEHAEDGEADVDALLDGADEADAAPIAPTDIIPRKRAKDKP